MAASPPILAFATAHSEIPHPFSHWAHLCVVWQFPLRSHSKVWWSHLGALSLLEADLFMKTQEGAVAENSLPRVLPVLPSFCVLNSIPHLQLLYLLCTPQPSQ